ncbi:MAG: hypothetical protein GXP34_09310 [Actinobacteria bacterium]|nr:hypothetical protein [Actinomycetota bacterium]
MKRITVLVLVVVLAAMAALPAGATIQTLEKQGHQDCGTYIAGIQSRSSGQVQHYQADPYGGVRGSWNDGSTVRTHQSIGNAFAFDWVVYEFGGVLYDNDTHGWCTDIS